MNQPGQVRRQDVMSVEIGLGVDYRVDGFQFHVLACRAGVCIEGKLPFMPGTGAMAIAKVIRRAVRQHQSLATPIGVKQQTIPEADLIAEETALENLVAPETPSDVPANGGGRPHMIVLPGGGSGN